MFCNKWSMKKRSTTHSIFSKNTICMSSYMGHSHQSLHGVLASRIMHD